eukprot:evm.model.NODE_35309_length_51595_cov_30.695145.9
MGKGLYDTEMVFKAAITECDGILSGLWGRSLLSIIFPGASDDVSLINETMYSQPALFALEYSLAMLWKSKGVIPDALLGHSAGESGGEDQGGVALDPGGDECDGSGSHGRGTVFGAALGSASGRRGEIC